MRPPAETVPRTPSAAPSQPTRASRRRAEERTTTRRPPPRNRRTVALVALAALVIGGLVAANGLVSCANAPKAASFPSRLVTTAEANRLAGVRLSNYTLGHAGISVTIGAGSSAMHLTGWVDWKQPLIYLNSLSAKASSTDGMIQAIPGVVAMRPGRYNPATTASKGGGRIDPYPPPPTTAPPTGWQVRSVERGSSIDTMITLLFAMRNNVVDSASQISAIGTKLVGTDEINGDPVDIIDGAAVPPPAGTALPSSSGLPFAAEGGQVRYWVDSRSQLLRASALINANTTLQIDFDRTDRADPSAIELLGGAAIKPTTLTTKQAQLLAHLRVNDYASPGGTITLAIPVSPTALYSGAGWIDWRVPALYATLRNNKASMPDVPVRADAGGLSTHGSLTPNASASPGTKPSSTALQMPSLDPSAKGWKRATWASFTDQYGEPDLELMLNEVIALSSAATVDKASTIKKYGSKLRTDTVNGVPVTVFEIRQPSEASLAPGNGRLRFWVDSSGLLRRLELRTRTGAFGYLTITPAHVPTLPDPIPSKG